MKLLTFSFLLLTLCAAAQNIGKFPIKHFKGLEGESFRSYVVYQDRIGNIFSGTESGVKVFKGGMWEEYYHSNEVKHLVQDENGALIIGGDKNFGKLTTDSIGKIHYENLSLNLTQDKEIDLLHKILAYNDGTFFHTDKRIIKVQNNRIIDYNFDDVLYAGAFNKNILIQRQDEGLFIYAGNDFRKINGSEAYANIEVNEIVDLSDGTFLILYEGRADFYDGEYFSRKNFRGLRDLEINSSLKIDNGIFLGSLDKGIFQYSENGDLIKLIEFDSWCNNLFKDNNQNIWISSNNGVSLLNAATGFELLTFNDEKGRSVALSGENIYLGTNRGTYSLPVSTFQQRGLRGKLQTLNEESVNDFTLLEEELLIASKDGEHFGSNVNQLYYHPEANILIKADKSGLSFYEKPYRQWVYANHIYGLEEEVRQITEDASGRLWAHSTRSGVVLLNFDHVLNTIDPIIYHIEETRTDHINGIFLINGRPVVTAKSGIYEFDQAADEFKKSEQYNNLFGDKNNILFLYQDDVEDIWYISESESGMINIEDKGVVKSAEKIRIPELSKYINLDKPGISSVSPNDILFNGLDGFIYVDKSAIKKHEPLELSLHRLVNEGQQSNIFFISGKLDSVYEFPRAYRSVSLSFNSTNDIYQDEILYSYKVNEDNWTPWQNENTIDVTLGGGNNTVQVKALTGMNNISETLTVPLFVTQKWYYEEWAKYLAIGLCTLLFISIWFYIRSLFKKRNLKINTLLQENRDQKRELRELSEKNEVLSAQLISALGESDIQIQLKRLSDENNNPEVKKAVKKLTKKLKTERKDPAELIIADPAFTSKLKIKYPTLTKKDIRLCSLLRMDLSTKEIAPMLDISVRGVEISRYRLRKKLDLNNEIVLADFLKNL